MKKKLTSDVFVNKWLQDYHRTNLTEVMEVNGWKDNEDHSREFYAKYPVTKEQHDEWYEWAIKAIMKEYRLSKKAAKRSFTFAYLNCAPSVKEN